ncbi:hypothetical protein F5Y05DRAFT_371431 [Hypoxylon sp. FL0543]|nr:hypothetical protein F5Y05DRAFT_371431 [Hypoxylon sp. FL0543]
MLSSIKSIAILAFVASATAGLIQRDPGAGTSHLGDDNKDLVRKDSQGQVHCKNQYSLNYNDMVYAERSLEDQFDSNGSFSGKSVSATYGSVVAYGCNYGNGQTITSSWLAAQYQLIAQNCGTTSPGWISYPDWKASYGIDSADSGFC